MAVTYFASCGSVYRTGGGSTVLLGWPAIVDLLNAAEAAKEQQLSRTTAVPEAPERHYLHCQICGFFIDASIEATKPALDFTMAGRTKTK